MFAKQYRLQKDKDFKLTFKKGKTFNNGFLFLKLRRNDLKVSRFGFVVSSKILKKATLRNKIKRRLRDIINKNLVNIKSGIDIVIGVKTEIISKDYQEIKKELESLLHKAGLCI